MIVRALSSAFALLAAPTLAAQSVAWQLPERGAAEFERTTTRFVVRPRLFEPGRGVHRVILPAGEGDHLWRYRTFRAGLGDDGWQLPDFDDAGWSHGRATFGDAAAARSPWPADHPYLDARTTFELGRRMPKAAVIQISHDDLATVWINGTVVYEGKQFLTDQFVALDDAGLDAFVPGRNTLAVRVHNTGGASLLDCGLTVGDRAYRSKEAATEVVKAEAAAASRMRASLFPGWRAPPYLCEGQLDDDATGMTRPPVDLRDLGAFLAFDLRRCRTGRSISLRLPRTYRFGDIVVKGRVRPPDGATGIQRIEVELRSQEPAVGDDNKRHVEWYVSRYYDYTLDGRLSIERRVDPERGVVLGFQTELEALVSPRRGDDSERRGELAFGEEWTLRRVRENRDRDFRTAVQEAIRKGGAKLRSEITNTDKSVLRARPGNRSYNTGRLALALLAMTHAEIPRDDEVLVKGLTELRKRKLVDTYSTAHAIMAIEALYSPAGEFEDLRMGLLDRPRKRQPSDEDKALLTEWSKILLNNVDTRVDAGYLLRFNYVREGRYDHSVNQYGLLGLYSAHLCGVEIPATVWEGAVNHLLDSQAKPTEKHKLKLSSYRQWEEEKDGRTTSAGVRKTPIAGWGYYGPKSNGVPQPIYGSMTCAGIAGLTICQAGLRDAGVTRGKLMGEADAARRSGFAWLADNFTVHWNPGKQASLYHFVYYYLYALERACELSGIALLDDRDWYYEGALTLIAQQHEDGGWPDDARSEELMERTAMAVLFLKKASLPVYTQRDG